MDEDLAGLVPEVTVVRDWKRDEWVYEETGAHKVGTGVAAGAPADVVIRYITAKANGRLKVHVNLG